MSDKVQEARDLIESAVSRDIREFVMPLVDAYRDALLDAVVAEFARSIPEQREHACDAAVECDGSCADEDLLPIVRILNAQRSGFLAAITAFKGKK